MSLIGLAHTDESLLSAFQVFDVPRVIHAWNLFSHACCMHPAQLASFLQIPSDWSIHVSLDLLDVRPDWQQFASTVPSLQGRRYYFGLDILVPISASAATAPHPASYVFYPVFNPQKPGWAFDIKVACQFYD